MITAPQMTDAEHNLARLIKLCCLVIITSAVIYLAMDRLEAILIPLMIAVAFSYLLTPLIDAFSCRHIEGYPAAFRLPRGLAVLLSFGVAVAILLSLGLIILQALSTFRARSSLYRARMEEVLAGLFEAAKELNERMGVNGPHSFEGGPNRGGTALEEASDMVKAFMKDISITDLILHLLGTAAHVAEDLMYIILFLVFMLMHAPNETPDGNSRHTVSAKVERQIFVYIRGKASISGFVGGCHAAVLWFVGLELWLPFGVVTFFLNFIPNVGGLAAVMLPMPVVALDPAFGPSGVATALLVVSRTLSLSLHSSCSHLPLLLSPLLPHTALTRQHLRQRCVGTVAHRQRDAPQAGRSATGDPRLWLCMGHHGHGHGDPIDRGDAHLFVEPRAPAREVCGRGAVGRGPFEWRAAVAGDAGAGYRGAGDGVEICLQLLRESKERKDYSCNQ